MADKPKVQDAQEKQRAQEKQKRQGNNKRPPKLDNEALTFIKEQIENGSVLYTEAVRTLKESVAKLLDDPGLKHFFRLYPYIEKLAADPKYQDKGKDLAEIMEKLEFEGTDKNGNIIPGSAWDLLLIQANEELEREQEETPDKQQSKRPKVLTVPTDKLNAQVLFSDWLDGERQLDGQLGMFPVKMEPDDYPKPLTLYYVINYPAELAQSERKLTPTDKRIYNATYWLQQANGSDMSFTQLFRAAGFGTTPNDKQIERIKKSVDKMRLTGIEWNNQEEAAAYHKEHGEYITYKGYLYPVEIVERHKLFNGKLVDSYIRVLKKLPLLEFAKERNQVATIPAAILQTKLRLTDLNIALQDYIIKRIEQDRSARKRNPNKAPLKILYKTLEDQTGANTRQKRRTLLANLYVYLEELKQKNYIIDYREDKTKSTGAVGVIIDY